MDQLTQVTISYPRLSINDNSTHHHPIPKPVCNTLLDLGISRYKLTKEGKETGRKLRQRMADSKITNGISVYSLNHLDQLNLWDYHLYVCGA